MDNKNFRLYNSISEQTTKYTTHKYKNYGHRE